MTVGWIAAKVMQARFEKAVRAEADAIASAGAQKGVFVSALLDQARKNLLERPRSWSQRVFSLKALHGFGFVMSSYQMFGRTIITNPNEFKGCHGQPAYKAVDSNGQVRLIPAHDPDGIQNPVTFAAAIFLSAFFVFLIAGATWSFFAARQQAKALDLQYNSCDESESEQK